MCRRNGIKYLVISHLFTQWGQKHAPKVMGLRKWGRKTDIWLGHRGGGEAYPQILSLSAGAERCSKEW